MMSKQAYTHSFRLPGRSLRLAPGQALRLGRGGGELVVLEGRVWFTRGGGAGDTGDQRIGEGQRLQVASGEVASGEDAVVEPWDAGTPAHVWWQPLPQGVGVVAFALGLRAVAFLAAEAATGLASLARGAAAGARRAQGGIGDPA